jgi:hypothetical protein
MWFQDREGNLLPSEELDMLLSWEIEERGIHVAERFELDF